MKPYQHRELEFLRSFIREALIFEDGYDYGMDSYGSGGGGGGEGGMFKLFIEPFLDVGKTVAGKTSEILVKTKTLAKVSFEAIVSSLVPFLSADYGKIFEKERAAIQSLRSKYGQIYEKNNKAFNNSDIAITAALSFPEFFLTSKFLKSAPEAAGEMASFFLGNKVNSNALQQLFFSPVEKFDLKNFNRKSIWESRSRRGQKQRREEAKEEREILSLRQEVMKQALKNPQVQEMKEDSLNVLKETANKFLEVTQEFLKMDSLESIYQMLDKAENNEGKAKIKKAISDMEEFNKNNKNINQKNNIETVVKGSKKAIKKMATNMLGKHLKQILSSGASEDAEIVKHYKLAINQIESM